MDFNELNPIEQIASYRDLSVDQVARALRRSVEIVLGHSVMDEIYTSDGRIQFIADNGKTIRMSQLLWKRVQTSLQNELSKESVIKAKNDHAQIVEGTIIKRTNSHLVVMTRYGEAKAPFALLPRHEKALYTIGNQIFFHVHKISTDALILDRTSRQLPEYIFKKILGDEDINLFRINRKFGQSIKAYVSALPSSATIEKLRMQFLEKRINFNMIETARIDLSQLYITQNNQSTTGEQL